MQPRDRLAHRSAINPWIVVAIVVVGQAMVVVDTTVVFAALPSIQADLGLSDVQRQWVINAYTLLFGGCLMLGGRLSDVLGRRRVYVLGTLLFTVASAADALATGPGVLIGARAVQGLGAAMLAPAALSIVTVTFDSGPRRTTAMALWGAVGAAGGGLGVFVGGALTEFLSWEWVFFVNLPIGVLTILGAVALITPDGAPSARRDAFDLVGATLVTTGLTLLVLAVIRVESSGWLGADTLAFAAGAVALLVAFVGWELRHPAPLVPLARLRNRPLVTANVGVLVFYGATASTLFFVSVYLQQGLGWGAFEAGLGLLPMFVLALVFAGVSERLTTRTGLRPPIVVGMLLAALGTALLTGVEADSTYARDVLPGVAILGIGGGCCYGPLTLLANACLGDRDAGLASGLYNTSNQIGAVLSVAVLSTVVQGAGAGTTDPARALTAGLGDAFTISTATLVVFAAFAVWTVRPRDDAALISGAVAPPAV